MTTPIRGEALWAAAGVDSHLPPPIAAARVARDAVLRGDAAGSEEPEVALERGWFCSPQAMAEVLAEMARVKVSTGEALGGTWPFLEVGGEVVAPGVPAAVGPAETEGPDGMYRTTPDAILREAAGREGAFVARKAGGDKAVFDLLWFGAQERYLVRDGILAVEDLFCRVSIPADPARLERLLVRERRLDPEVLAGLDIAPAASAPTIEVARAADPDELRWWDPAAFIGARVDVTSVSSAGARLKVDTERGNAVLFECLDNDNGWIVRRIDGDYPFDVFALKLVSDGVALVATPGADIDLLRPGMRGRLAFDLGSDLMGLQKS